MLTDLINNEFTQQELYKIHIIKTMITNDHRFYKYIKYEAFNNIVMKTIKEYFFIINDGYLFYKRTLNISDIIKIRLDLYESRIQNLIAHISMFFITIIRFQKYYKRKLWKPNGKLYINLQKKTKIGKKSQ